MSLNLKHFDTRTGEWITIPNSDKKTRQETPSIILTENLENTLFEAFIKQRFPDKDYSNAFTIGHIDEASTPTDLSSDHHPNGDVLLLSSKSRLLYGPELIREQLIKKLNPDLMHNGAYGSLFTGECKNSYQGQATYLVIDDSNGENGGYLDNEQARKLVGDCHGKISPSFSKELSGTNNEVIQFRLGNLDDTLYGKGTLAPKEISSYFKDKKVGKQVAFIVPTSSFKGAGKGTVKPGLYTKEIWLGEKERSQKGEIALSQLLASYPKALKDFIPKLDEHLSQLNNIIKDPRLLAKNYEKRYEERRLKQEDNWQPPTPSEAIERYNNYLNQGINSSDHDLDNSTNEEFLYLALKADPNHQRLLGTKKFIQSLQEFVRRDFLESAIGKIFKFDRGMIIPSKDLKTGEICVPWMNDGEQVLNFRSPFLNHNGMIHSTNKYVEAMYSPNGKSLKGVIIVNDEDYNRIVQRTITEAKTTKPDVNLIDIPEQLNDLSVDERIAFTDQLNLSLKEAGLKIQVPYESDCERMGADFDGDCIGVAEASRFPNLTQDVLEKTQPENLFRPTRKEAKVSFPEGTNFETIAIHQADSISVGSINNNVTTFEALLSELEIYQEYGTIVLKQQLATQLIEKAQQVLKLDKKDEKEGLGDRGWVLGNGENSSTPSTSPNPNTQNPTPSTSSTPNTQNLTPSTSSTPSEDSDDKNFQQKLKIPEELRPYLQEIAQYSNNKTLSNEDIKSVFSHQRKAYRWMIEEGCYQNQISVDSFKSARKADQDSIADLTKLLYRKVAYIKDKKSFSVYRQEGLKINGYSPSEITASMVNAKFKEHHLFPNAPLQYKHLFSSDYTPQQILEAKQIKAQYDDAYNLASTYNRKLKTEGDTNLKITTQNGTHLEISNYTKFIDHAQIKALSKTPLNLRLIPNNNYQTKSTHQLLAQYETSDKKWKNLGTVCELSRHNLGLKAGLNSNNCQVNITQGLDKKEIQLLFYLAKNMATEWRKQLEETQTPEALEQYANATWHLCHNNNNDTINNFVYDTFSDKILQQISQPDLQFTKFLVGKLKEHNQVAETLWNSGEQLDLQLQLKEGEKVWYINNPETQEYQSFGVASDKDYQLPVNTKVKGTIEGDLFTTARLDIDHPSLKGKDIIIGNMVKYPKVGYEFKNEGATIVLSQSQNTAPQPIIKFEGKQLGQLDNNGVNLFKQYNSFRDQLSFEVTLNSYGEGKNKEIIATTEKGASFQIEKSHFLGEKDLKDKVFNGEKVKVTLALAPPKKQVMIAQIKLQDGTLLPIGEFTTNQKASKEALTEVGLFKDGATFDAKITSRVTAARIIIDPNTIEYPELKQGINASIPISQDVNSIHHPINPTAQLFIEQLTTQPTLMSRFDQEWQLTDGTSQILHTLGLNVDLKKVEATKNFLDKNEIPYVLLSPDDARLKLETERGYGVFWLVESDVSPNIRQAMEEKVNGVYERNLTDNSLVDSYTNVIESIPILSEKQLKTRLENSQESFNAAIKDIPKRQTKTLLKQESIKQGASHQVQSTIIIESEKNNQLKKPHNSYELVPKSDNPSIEKNRIKDREMAAIATQFIGFPAQINPNTLSSTRDYQTNWNKFGLANTGNYNANDIVMISGSGPWRGVTQEQITKTFEQKYKPLLEKVIEAKAIFLVGNAQGTDQLVVNYLKQQGYQLTLKNNYYSANSLEPNHSPINLASNSSELEKGSPLQKTTNTNINNELKNNQLISNSAANNPQRLLPIVGQPIAMNYALRLHGEPNPLSVNTTIEAMRGLGRNHTTRTFEPYKIYGFKEGDLALAYSGKKENPTQQVLFQVGKQYKITDEMINDPQYRQQWANSEKHSSKELDSFKGKQSWGLEYEPIGDYRSGKVYDFQSGKDITSVILEVKDNSAVKESHQEITQDPEKIKLLIPEVNNLSTDVPKSNIDDKIELLRTESKQVTNLSIDDIPSDPEFDMNNLMEQQKRTEIVAPIALEYLKIQDPRRSNTRHFKSPNLTFDYDGHYLTIKDNKDDSIKMKAHFTGVDPVTKKTQWLSALPENSPGLTQDDVTKWTSEKTKTFIKEAKIQQALNQQLSNGHRR